MTREVCVQQMPISLSDCTGNYSFLLFQCTLLRSMESGMLQGSKVDLLGLYPILHYAGMFCRFKNGLSVVLSNSFPIRSVTYII